MLLSGAFCVALPRYDLVFGLVGSTYVRVDWTFIFSFWAMRIDHL